MAGNAVRTTKEIIISCIGFIAGYKADKALRFYEVKSVDFPANLLSGKEKEQEVMQFINQGYSNQAVADKLGLSKGTVTKHISFYKQRVAFYYEFVSFWEFIKPVLDMRLFAVVGDIDKGFVSSCESRGVYTVGELLDIYTHYPLPEAMERTAQLRLDRKKRVFDAISDECFKLIEPVPLVGYVLFLKSEQLNLFSESIYGYWTGKHYVSHGHKFPLCNDLITENTKVYLSENKALAASKSAFKSFGYGVGFTVEVIPYGFDKGAKL